MSALVALACLAAPAPASAEPCDPPSPWPGIWEVGSSYKDDKGKTIIQTYGTITFRFDEGSNKDLTGSYSFSGPNGIAVATLDKDCGRSISGTYRDVTGEGRFQATLNSTGKKFKGKYWPCLYVCSSRPWWGEKL